MGGAARAGLLKFIQRKAQNADAEGEVKGAQAIGVYTAGRDVVYVRLEIETVSNSL